MQSEILSAIESTAMAASLYRMARRLLDRTPRDSDYVSLTPHEAMQCAGTANPETLRGQLTRLHATGLITHWRRDDKLYVVWQYPEQRERMAQEERLRAAEAAHIGALLAATRAELAAAKPVQHVYFIHNASDDTIKIGIAADVTQRLKQLQPNYAGELKLLGTIPAGGRSTEAELHERFAQYRLHGEWFMRHPEIEAAIPCLTNS